MGQQHTYSCAVSHPYYTSSIKYRTLRINTFRPYQVLPGLMAYMAQGSLLEFDSLAQLRDLLVNNGWTWITAVSTMLFSLMHWPCTTTLLTIRKESGSLKWTAMSFLVPTVCGIVLCFAFATVARMFV